MRSLLWFAAATFPALALASPAISPGARLKLEVPPSWNDGAKSVEQPEFLTLNEAGTIETCTFRGGVVTVKRVSGGQVIFAPAAAGAGRCAQLTTSVEQLREWEPAAVAAKRKELEQKQAAFRALLKEDVKGIIEKGADPCVPEDAELKSDSVYKVTGRVFVYGPGTEAQSVEGGGCQVELDSLIHILGFSRAADSAVATYHRPAKSTGFVPAGLKRTNAPTCRDGEQIVFSLARLKSHFQFAPASIEESLKTKGIVAVFNAGRKKTCDRVVGQDQRASSLRGEMRAGNLLTRTAEEGESAPAPADHQGGDSSDQTGVRSGN